MCSSNVSRAPIVYICDPRIIVLFQVEGRFITVTGGNTGVAILTVSEKNNADIIVMGSSGHNSYIHESQQCSLGEFVEKHSRCQVLRFGVRSQLRGLQRKRSISEGKQPLSRKEKNEESASKDPVSDENQASDEDEDHHNGISDGLSNGVVRRKKHRSGSY